MATAYGWGREFEKLGCDVRLIPPVYVKPFVKRQKNDATDAEAILEAALRPTMRFFAVKTEDQQARARGPAHLKRLADAIAGDDTALHAEVRDLGRMYLGQIEGLNTRVAELDAKMRCAAKKADLVRRTQTMPGVVPVTALAIETFARDLATFRRGCDFAAWLGLVPKQHSTGGKARLGKTSKMRQRDSGHSWSLALWLSSRLSSGLTHRIMAG